jgi:hypothetical protein
MSYLTGWVRVIAIFQDKNKLNSTTRKSVGGGGQKETRAMDKLVCALWRSPLLMGPETGRIETIRVPLSVLGATYAVTGRDARGSGLLRVPPTEATGVGRKDAHCSLSESEKGETPNSFPKEKGQVGGTKRERARYRASELSPRRPSMQKNDARRRALSPHIIYIT